MNYVKAKNGLGGRAGHQMAEWSTSLAIARHYNIGFVHTPFNGQWESKLNFGKGEKTLNDITYENTVHLHRFDRNNIEDIKDKIEKHSNTLFMLHHKQNLNNHWVNERILKEKWKEAPLNQPWMSDRDKPIIGVHIRRGDVTSNRFPKRWVSLGYYNKVIENKINEKFDDYELHVFSEGKKDQFKTLNKHKPIFHLSEDKFETFNKMTKCDALITGKSGYSYFASILSEAKIFAIPFWHHYPSNHDRIIKLKS